MICNAAIRAMAGQNSKNGIRIVGPRIAGSNADDVLTLINDQCVVSKIAVKIQSQMEPLLEQGALERK